MTEIRTQLPKTIAANIDHFTGRAWLLPPLLDWLEHSDQRIFLVTGGPGTGKSMISAWLAGYGPAPTEPAAAEQLVLLRSKVKAAHFCVATSGNTDPKTLASEVAKQLIRNVQGFDQALVATMGDQVRIGVEQHVDRVETGGSVTGVYIADLNLGAISEELSFNRTLRDPLKQLYQDGHDEPMLLLIDALDEAQTYKSDNKLVQLLAKLADLPPQVRILATTRDDQRVIKFLRDAKAFDLINYAPPDIDDIQAYTTQRLITIVPALDATARAALAQRISTAAEPVFLYAALVLDELGPRLAQDPGLDLDTLPLPKDLSGLYHDFLNRELGGDENVWYDSFKPILGLIAVAQGDGLTITQLAAISGKEVEHPLRICKQYLVGDLPEGPFRVFHESFREFLLEDKGNVDYHIDAAKMHAQIVDHYRQTLAEAGWATVTNDEYFYDHLVDHLDQLADHKPWAVTELQSLFANDAWLQVRVSRSGYRYDGYLADLNKVWQRAHEETLRQIEAGEEPAVFAECVRYALIRTSINSLSSNYEPALVARALETGLWSDQRALRAALRIPDPEARAKMLTTILAVDNLSLEVRGEAEQAGLAATLAIRYEWPRAKALTALAPQLSGELLAQGLAAALAFQDEGPCARALAALAPQLSGEEKAQALTQGLAAAMAIQDEDSRARALAALAPHLSGELLAQGLAAALAIQDEDSRADALVALAPQLSGELLARGLAAALAIHYEWSRVKALAALAPQLSGDLLAQGLAAALAFQDEGPCARALAALAPQLSVEEKAQALTKGLAAALAIQDKGTRAYTLGNLVPQLSGEDKVQALTQGLAAVLAMDEKWSRPYALAALAPQLSGELLAQALDAALAIYDERSRTRMLVALVPHLSGELLAQGLAAVLAIQDEELRTHALAGLEISSEGFVPVWFVPVAFPALAPQLSGELLAQGLAAALAIHDELFCVYALAALASQLSGEQKAQALDQGLAAALAIEDDQDRARALAALAPQWSEELLDQRLAAALAIQDKGTRAYTLANLVPQLSGEDKVQALTQGLAAALAIQDEGSCARALAALAPQLSGEEKAYALSRALAAALAIQDEWPRTETLAALAPQLSGEEKAQALTQGLAAALAIQDEWLRTETLAALAPQLSGELLAQGLAAALAFQDEWLRTETLAALAPQLSGELLAQGLAAALAFQDEGPCARALAALAPQLSGEEKAYALSRALAAALAIQNEESRAHALAALASWLSGELLAQALDAALAIRNEWYHVRAFAALEPQAQDKEVFRQGIRISTARHFWNNIRYQVRRDLLSLISDTNWFNSSVFDTNTLSKIAAHIIEICRHWTWL